MSALAATTSRAAAQCEGWSTSFGPPREATGMVTCFAAFDDGSGPALYVGGDFGAGGGTVRNLGRWNGTSWSVPGTGISPFEQVDALIVFDDGSGPALYVGGSFPSAGGVPVNHIARWDGQVWSAVGTGVDGPTCCYAVVSSFAAFDDGSGPALYAAGSFFAAGGAPANNIAKWDGANWSPVGSGVNGAVSSLLVHDDGTGPALYAGGVFTLAGGSGASRVAKWDGSAWSVLGSGVSGSVGSYPTQVRAMCVHDDGTGPAMYVTGEFTAAGAVSAHGVARWDGSSWSAVGAVDAFGFAISSYDDGSGSKLFLGGNFSYPAGNPGGPAGTGVLVWDGANWFTPGAPDPLSYFVLAFATFDYGAGPILHMGGDFSETRTLVSPAIIGWDGQGWIPLFDGPETQGVDDWPRSFAVYNDGIGPKLVVAGQFSRTGAQRAYGLAFWDGSAWDSASLPSGTDATTAGVFDIGPGPQLFVAGYNFVSRWFGSSLQPFGSPIGTVYAMERFDSGTGPYLYVGGNMNGGGQNPFAGIMRASWNGSWSALGTGVNGAVNALRTYDDGSGTALYVGGTFTTAGGVPASYIARWNGSSWSSVGGGLNGIVNCLAVSIDGSELYAGGGFTLAGGTPASRVARWNGTSWTPLGVGFNDIVRALVIWDDGNGAALHAGGHFSLTGGQQARHLARWDGNAWSEIDGGANANVLALGTYDDGSGSGSDLYVAGDFDQAGGVPSKYIARWRGCSDPGTRMCFGDGSLATACPCGNVGFSGHGCAHSSSTNGAELRTDGTIHPDTVTLLATEERPTALTIFLQGSDVIPTGVVFGDGLRCASGTLKRLYVKSAVGGAVSAPGPGDLSITARSAALGNPIAPGARRYYQTYFRDSNQAFCPVPQGNSFNSTNAVKIVW